MYQFIQRLRLFMQFVPFMFMVSFTTDPTHLFRASGGKKKPGDKAAPNGIVRDVLIGYIRQSMSEDEADINSAERQQANLEEAAKKLGLRLEIYRDVGGHRSGRDIKNRPDWVKASLRLSEPDVKGLAVNELSRAHRRGWRAGQLLDWLQERNQMLVLARDNRVLDLSTHQDRMIAAFVAFIDEYYAEDIAERMRDSNRRRQQDGKTVAQPPPGTIRDADGFLMRSPRGAWLLADGQAVAGDRDAPPSPDVIWRGYADGVQFALDLYSHNDVGTGGITRQLRENGWFVRTDSGAPRLPKRDDVRRIIAAWPQYAGLVVVGRSKDRRRGDVPLNWADTGRSVFPLSLLRTVASVEHERRQTRGAGSVQQVHPQALRGRLYCEQCERRVDETGNLDYRSHLTGTNQYGRPRYRHAEGVPCRCTVRSILAREIEPQVVELLRTVHLKEDMMGILSDAGQSISAFEQARYEELEAARRGTLRLNKSRLLALQTKLDNGDKTLEEYQRVRESLVAKIAELEAQVISRDSVRLDFARFLSNATSPAAAYELASPIDRQILISRLFEGIWYDLDTRQITRVRWQPWAKEFLTV